VSCDAVTCSWSADAAATGSVSTKTLSSAALLATRPLLTADGAIQMAALQTSLSATITSGGSMYDDGQLRVRADLRAAASVLSLYTSSPSHIHLCIHFISFIHSFIAFAHPIIHI